VSPLSGLIHIAPFACIQGREPEERIGKEPRRRSARLLFPAVLDYKGVNTFRPIFGSDTMSGYILALDQGTTSSRAIVFDRDGNPVASAQQEFTQHYPRPGWIEHDPFEIWSSQREVMRRAATNAGVGPADLAGIGITNQRETTIVWDRQTGRPVHNAIVWQDRRTAGYIDGLKQRGLEAFFRERTGLVLDAYFSASKLAWLLEHVDGVREAARAGRLAFGTVDTWLLWQLTGGAVHATDASNASRTLMFNIHSLEWDGDILRELDIPASLLPEVRSSSEVYGETIAEVLGEPVPIAGIAGDQHAATFGQACFEPGQAKNTYGTGCFLLLNTGDRPVASGNKLLTTIGWRRAEETVYALEGSIFVGGEVGEWRSGRVYTSQSRREEGEERRRDVA
jgi:glycerol kinase